jgi:hypothetical protein
MSARAASSALTVFMLVALASCRTAHAGPWLPAPGEYYTELRGSVLSTTSYHNADGDRVALPWRMEERSAYAYTELGWKKSVSVVLAAPFTSTTARTSFGNYTNTGLQDLLLGFRYGLARGRSALALELDWQPPLGYSRRTSLLGDGLQQLSLSALAGSALGSRGFLQLGAGMGYRFLAVDQGAQTALNPMYWSSQTGTILAGDQLAEQWSRPFVASADLGLWIRPTLLLGGRYSGTVAMSSGEAFPERTVHLAGPVLLWRVDDRLDLSAGSWSTAKATNSLHYDRIYVALTFKQTRLNRLQGFLGGTKAP